MGSERSAGGFQSRVTYAVPTPNASLRCAGGALKPALVLPRVKATKLLPFWSVGHF